MSKVADYLRGHITGEVTTRNDIREALSTDLGVLKLKPEMVVYPRTTNDIRKITRFAWQLAEKGHTLPITVRGAGTNTTGAAIGKGASVVTTAHMNHLFEYDDKQKLIRLQPGVTITSLSQALALHGTTVPPLVGSYRYGTVGGALGEAVSGLLVGKYGRLETYVDRLEVVLANGDLLQTGRLNKREFSKKAGIQGFEGDIYRGIDTILEDYAEVLDTLRVDDGTGYNAIADVKQKDGSFDLTPLFLGSQGTLGIISEMILKTEFHGQHYSVASLVFASADEARDALDPLCALKPAFIEYFDAQLFENASDKGKVYDFYQQAKQDRVPRVVILVGFDDFNERQRSKLLKRVEKLVANFDVSLSTGADETATDMMAALDVVYYTTLPEKAADASPDIFGDFQVPADRFEEFSKALEALASVLHVDIPLSGHVFTGIYSVHPMLQLNKVSDKQKVFKIIDELTKVVLGCGGSMVSGGGEGRLKSRSIYSQINPKLVEMYATIKKVFDPHGILNPGVKEVVDIRTLAVMLRDSHDAGQLARFGLR